MAGEFWPSLVVECREPGASFWKAEFDASEMIDEEDRDLRETIVHALGVVEDLGRYSVAFPTLPREEMFPLDVSDEVLSGIVEEQRSYAEIAEQRGMREEAVLWRHLAEDLESRKADPNSASIHWGTFEYPYSTRAQSFIDLDLTARSFHPVMVHVLKHGKSELDRSQNRKLAQEGAFNREVEYWVSCADSSENLLPWMSRGYAHIYSWK